MMSRPINCFLEAGLYGLPLSIKVATVRKNLSITLLKMMIPPSRIRQSFF